MEPTVLEPVSYTHLVEICRNSVEDHILPKVKLLLLNAREDIVTLYVCMSSGELVKCLCFYVLRVSIILFLLLFKIEEFQKLFCGQTFRVSRKQGSI